MASYSLILSAPLDININLIPVCVCIYFMVKDCVTISLMPSNKGSDYKAFGLVLHYFGTI